MIQAPPSGVIPLLHAELVDALCDSLETWHGKEPFALAAIRIPRTMGQNEKAPLYLAAVVRGLTVRVARSHTGHVTIAEILDAKEHALDVPLFDSVSILLRDEINGWMARRAPRCP